MNIVVAIDSLKGSLSSMEAGNAIREGILCAIPDSQVQVMPLADGGEGTMEALLQGLCGEKVYVDVHGPLETPVHASYGILGNLAIMEMASAAGIELVDKGNTAQLRLRRFLEKQRPNFVAKTWEPLMGASSVLCEINAP